MAKVSNLSKRRNAVEGAIKRWCPECKRKAALSAWPEQKCRYCGHRLTMSRMEHKKAYADWIKRLTGEKGDDR